MSTMVGEAHSGRGSVRAGASPARLGHDVTPRWSNIEPSRHTMGDYTVEQGNAESPGSDGASP